MKTFRKLLSEVAQPKAGDEKHFKDKHVVEKIPHPHADDETFKGSTKKDKTRRADYEPGQDEDVYEALDPVGKADADIDNDGDVDSSDKYLHARRKAISKSIKKRKMKEDVEDLDEMKLSAVMKKIKDGKWEAMTDVKKGKHVEVRDTETGKRKMVMVEKAESEAQAIAARIALKHKREGTKPEAGSASAEMMKMSEKDLEDFTKAKKGAPYKVDESVEQLDELSPKTMHNYTKKAVKSLERNARKGGYSDKSGNYDMADARYKTADKRMKGIATASKRLADKAMKEDAWEEIPMMKRQLRFMMDAAEEIMEYLGDCDYNCVDPEEWFQNKLAHVHGQMMTLYAYVEGEEMKDLDEVTRSAIKRPIKYTDARGVTRTRMTTTRPIQHDQHGQEKIRESLQEAVSAGTLKLDDGSSVKVSKQDADLLNQMMKDLNSQNRKMMQKTMMMDKAGFEEIVGFAREAL